MKKGEEYYVQALSVNWFRQKYPDYIIFSVPNEATWRSKNYFSNLGTLGGVSDTIVVLPNQPLFIEFKAIKGRQTSDQKDFQKKVESLGYKYYICRSTDEFKNIITDNI